MKKLLQTTSFNEEIIANNIFYEIIANNIFYEQK